MKAALLSIIFASTLCGPANAQDGQSFVTGWLDSCYTAADAAFRDVPLPKDRGFDDALLIASQTEFRCGHGPRTICSYSADVSGCLTAARTWMEQERDRLFAQLPRALADGQSPVRRKMIRQYYGFIAAGGQQEMHDIFGKSCVGSGAALPELGLSRQECDLMQVSAQLQQARHYNRRVVAGILR